MKKLWILTIAVCLLLSAAAGCKKATEAAASVDTAETGGEQAAGMVSPIHEVESYQALLKAQPANMLSDVPYGASDVVYSYIDNEPVISQIQFTLDGNDYTYRAASVSEAAQTDIAGIYEELGKEKELIVEDNATAGGKYALRYSQGTTMGLATWYYTPTGCQYSLWTKTGCDVDQQIEEVVDTLLPIAYDANGNPLTPAQSTPVPAAEEGKVQGTVTDLQNNVLTLYLDNSNTLQFMLLGVTTDAKIGDVVELTYSGNPLDAPQALTVTILSKAPEATRVSGTVYRYTKGSVFVQTTGSNIFGFLIDGNTTFKGVSNTLKVGNTVTVTYTGAVSDSPVATVIETTAVSTDPEPTAKPEKEEPVNKTLLGTVSALTSKKLTMYTDTGHTYSFIRDTTTVIAGDYSLEYGCRIRVLYDGYASNTPHAKRIDVLAPPAPDPAPEPKPYVPTKHTITGYISMSAGNGLVIDGDDGTEYSFLLRAPTVVGEVVVGFRATVKYQVEQDGTSNVTYIETYPPVVYDTDPVQDDPGENLPDDYDYLLGDYSEEDGVTYYG